MPSPLTILAVGSSTWAKAYTDGTGPSNARVSASTSGTNFQPIGTTGTGLTVLGDELVKALNVDVRFIPAAVGGSTLAEWEANGSSYRAAAVAAAQAAGDVAAIVVAVGFNDTRQKLVASRASHLAMLRSFYTKLRNEIGKPNVPIFVETSQKLNDGDATSNAQIVMVRSAELDVLADSNNYLYCHTIDLEQLADGIHQTSAAYVKSSTRGGASMASMFKGTGDKRGPRIVGIVPVSHTQTRIQLAHNTGNDVTPTADITGFGLSLDDFATVLTPLSVVRETATSLLVTHPSTGPNVVTAKMRYQMTAAPSVVAPLMSNSTPPYPADYSADAISFQTIASPPVANKVAQINFRDTIGQNNAPNPAGWVGVVGARDAAGSTAGRDGTSGRTIGLTNPDGVSLGWSLELTTPSIGCSTSTITGTQAFPADVANTWWFNGDSPASPPNPRITITTHALKGLNPAKLYKLDFYGRREGTTARETKYTAGGVSVNLVNNNNNGNLGTIDNVAPDASGNIVYSYEPAGTALFGYINALIVTEK